MKSPARDPGFTASPIHGAAAQGRLARQVARFARRRLVAIDVGAHVGTWTVPLSALFEHVYAVEPVPENFACLVENTRHLTNVTRHQCAVGPVPGRTGFGCADNSGTYWMRGPGEIPVARLDDLIPPGTDLLKLDVEGAEGLVLQGASRVLGEDRPVVFFEDNGLGPKHFTDWVDPKDVLRSHGYSRRGRMEKNELWAPR